MLINNGRRMPQSVRTVAIPLMSANKTRAMATEAEAALGTIRSAMRAMFAETGDYSVDLDGDPLAEGTALNVPGIGAGDLDGRWFSDECYTIGGLSATGFTVTATGSASTAPRAADIQDVVITLNQDGEFDRVSGF